MVSKSGSNRFSGSLFEFLRNDALDSANKYDDIKQPLELNQFGGSIGGPIARNKTFFFVSYEGLRQKTGLTFTEAVPSDEARRRIMAGEPVGSGAGPEPGAHPGRGAAARAGSREGPWRRPTRWSRWPRNTSEAEQNENSMSLRIDHRFSNSHNVLRPLSLQRRRGGHAGPHRDAAPRAGEAAAAEPGRQLPEHLRAAWSTRSRSATTGRRPAPLAFGPAGYDPVGVSLSGTFTSSSIDARGNTGIARSGLLIRATSAASTTGSVFDPRSISLQDTVTWTRGAHTFKSGFEYRDIAVGLPVPRQPEITYNSINDFIDNRPNSVAVNLDSPFFTPQQFYLIGFVQDSWRANNKLTLELGLRYDYYSVVKEADGRARPFFVEDNAFGTDPDNFYNADKNNFSPRLSAAYQLNEQTVVRGRFRPVLRSRPVRGPHPADRELHRAPPRRCGRRPEQRPRLPGTADVSSADAVDPRLHAQPARRVQRPVRRQRVARAARRGQPDGRLHRQPGQGHVPARRLQHARPRHARRGRAPSVGQVDYKTSGCVDGLVINGNPISGCGYASYNALQISATRRFRVGLHRRHAVPVLEEQGHHAGVERGGDRQNTFDFETEYGTNPQDIPHTFNGSMVYLIPGDGILTGGWRVGGIVNARSGVPLNVTINRPDNVTVNGVNVTNIPGGNSRGTQRPDLVPGVDPYIEDGGVRWINPAAFTTPQPGTFGNLPRNFLRGPSFWQARPDGEQGLPLPATRRRSSCASRCSTSPTT